MTFNQVLNICKSTHVTDQQMCQVIEYYIFERKGVKVKINQPKNLMNIQLMSIAFESACNYYLK